MFNKNKLLCYSSNCNIIENEKFMKTTYTESKMAIQSQELSNNLLIGCMDGDIDLLKNTLNFAKYNNITLDFSQDEGLLGVIAAQKGLTSVLKIIDEYDSNIIRDYGTELLSQAAVNGEIECVEFLLSKQIDPTPLKDTSAYNNYVAVEQIFESYLEQHNKNVEIKELGSSSYTDLEA